jgi:hypothetical protein
MYKDYGPMGLPRTAAVYSNTLLQSKQECHEHKDWT